MAFAAPSVVDTELIRDLVGETSLKRGRTYARKGAAYDLTWKGGFTELSGKVEGSRGVAYRTTVKFSTSSHPPGPSFGACTCPMRSNCKHVAALLMTSNEDIAQSPPEPRGKGIRAASKGAGTKAASGSGTKPGSKTKPGEISQAAAGKPGSAVVCTRPAASITSVPDSKQPEPKKPKPKQPKQPAAWERRLDELVKPSAGAGPMRSNTNSYGYTAPQRAVPLALQFELREEADYSAVNYRQHKPANAPRVVRLLVRPVQLGTKGKWIFGQLRWDSFQSPHPMAGFERDHCEWLRTFAAISGGWNTFSGELRLDDFRTPLLWDLLARGKGAGVEFVGARNAQVTLHDAVSADLDVSAEGRRLSLRPHAEVEGRQLNPLTLGVIGTPGHGLFWWENDDSAQPARSIGLAPTSAPVSETLRPLIAARTQLQIPGTGREAFLKDYYPRLQQQVRVLSSDGSVDLPDIPLPILVLTVSYVPGSAAETTKKSAGSRRRSAVGPAEERNDGTLGLSWSWDYTYAGTTTTHSVADDGSEHRDRAFERQQLSAVADVLGGFAAAWHDVFPRPEEGFTGSSTVIELRGVVGARFVAEALPQLEAVEQLRVVQGEDVPDYAELTQTPAISVSTTDTEDRDWFDLGVAVSLGDTKVPFAELFRALALGDDHLLLENGSYFALDQPEFVQLRQLIEEARSLQEKDGNELRISRYQAGLWDELTDLAVVAEQAESWQQSVAGLLNLAEVPDREVPAEINATLRPYQQEGFNWLAFLWEYGLGGVLADDMGLGKTLQALALMCHARQAAGAETRPFLVVAPTSVVPNWAAEIGRFAPGLRAEAVLDTLRRSGADPAHMAAGNDVVVVSYTLFRLDYEAYAAQDWAGLILDEAQFVKNPMTRASQNARNFPAPFKLAITGTPMENNLMELWSLFAITAPGLFPSSQKFAEHYQRPIEKESDGDRLAQLRRRIRPLIMRRTKEVVATELPPKQEQVLELELAPRHRTIYQRHLQRERQKVLGLLDDMNKNRFEIFRSLTMLRRLSLDASLVDEKYASVPSSKLDALFEQLADIVAEGHKALIFSQFTGFLAKAAERLDAAGMDYAYLDGKTRRRAQVIEKFKSGQVPVFLISLKAGGFGLNLAEADYCFVLDPWWNPASESQAVDRAHRIGQKRQVMVYRLVAKDTIEEKVMALKEKKAKLFTAVMDDDSMFSSALSAGDVRSLFE